MRFRIFGVDVRVRDFVLVRALLDVLLGLALLVFRVWEVRVKLEVWGQNMLNPEPNRIESFSIY